MIFPGEHIIWGYQGVEGPGAEGDRGEEIEVHAVGWMVRGLKDEAREEGEGENLKLRARLEDLIVWKWRNQRD